MISVFQQCIIYTHIKNVDDVRQCKEFKGHLSGQGKKISTSLDIWLIR